MSELLRRAILKEGGLVTTSDIARLWDVTPNGAKKILDGAGAPAPLDTVADGRSKVWAMHDVLAFRPAAEWSA